MGKKIIFIVVSIAAALAALCLYRPWDLYFLADDFIHIPESRYSFLSQRNSLRPVGNISLHLDYLWSGKNALGYHISNLLFHVINSLLVFFFLQKLLNRYGGKATNTYWPWAATVLFFVYPFHSESVFWIIGRSGSLGCMFFLGAAILYINRKSIAAFVGALLLFELALLSYESSWIFPAIAFLLTIFDQRAGHILKRRFAYPLIVVAVFLLHIIWRYSITQQLFHSYDSNSFLNLDIIHLASNFGRLLARTMLPPFVHTNYLMLAFALAIAALGWLFFIMKKYKKFDELLILLLACWLISYVPYLSLGIDTHGVEGERYLYLPSVFFCAWLMYLLAKVFPQNVALVIYSSILMLSIYWLKQSRNYFTKASLISRATIEGISALHKKENIYLENLPQYNKGAVVFRLGLHQGVEWLTTVDPEKVKIISIDDSDVNVREWHSTNWMVKPGKGTPGKFHQMMVIDTTMKTNFVSIDTSIFYHPFKDARFIYTDTTLLIER